VINNVVPFRPLRRRQHREWMDVHVRFWAETLDRLASYIQELRAEEKQMSDIEFSYPKDEPAMIATRSFDAPVALVWKVFTDPVHVARWWGPKSISPVTKIDRLELRPGGRWRFICGRPDGSGTIVFTGKYLDVVPLQKLVNTFGVEGQFEGSEAFPGTHTFEERNGRTYYRSYALLPDFNARDAVIATGMEKGGRESLEQLGDLIDELHEEAV